MCYIRKMKNYSIPTFILLLFSLKSPTAMGFLMEHFTMDYRSSRFLKRFTFSFL